MQRIFDKIRLFVTDRALMRRVYFVLGAFFFFRLLAAIPVPGVNALALERLFSQNQFLGFLNIFSGGGLSTLSIVLLGVGPYITASIIMQLMTIIVPKLKEMYQEEGEAGRVKFAQYGRLLTLPLAVLQGIAFIILLSRQGILPTLSPFQFGVSILVVTAGSILLMWLGELVSEFGIGNGVSLIIFSGIVSRLPDTVSQALFTYDVTQLPTYLAAFAAGLLIIAGVVYVTEAERPVPVTYAKQVRGNSVSGGGTSFLPLRLNQAGVIPIIFALSLLLIPQMIGGLILSSSHVAWYHIANNLAGFANNEWYYGSAYFVLVVLFTYFYTAVTFDPDQMADNLQRSGAFIPGVRPGRSTSEFLARVITRITLPGALFLGIIAVLPIIMQGLTGSKILSVGGTALLIVVSVVLDLVRRVDAQLSVREY